MWIGGYDEDFIRGLVNDPASANKTVDELISWMPITSRAYW